MEDERRKKILLMRIGVIIIIVLIFFLWVYNMKNLWRPITLDNNESKTQNSDFTNLKEDINKQMAEMKKKLSDISNKKQEAKNKAGEELLNNLLKETEKVASSSQSTSTASISTSTVSTPKVKNSSCPEYIDCMPTIGEARPCEIPVGCENITVIAY